MPAKVKADDDDEDEEGEARRRASEETSLITRVSSPCVPALTASGSSAAPARVVCAFSILLRCGSVSVPFYVSSLP